MKMEGIILDMEAYGSIFAFLSTLCLFAIVVATIVLGSVADREAAGLRVHWTAEPIPGTEERKLSAPVAVPKAA